MVLQMHKGSSEGIVGAEADADVQGFDDLSFSRGAPWRPGTSDPRTT